MYRLGRSPSQASEWERSSAFYSRLTFSKSTGISRPIQDYPQPLTSDGLGESDPGQKIRMFRTELLDIGHVQNFNDLSKYFQSYFV